MGFMKKIWKNRQSENPTRRRLTATGEANVYDVAREEGLVLEEGDAFSDQTMNDLENRIAAGFDVIDTHAADSGIHVTAAKQADWDSKAAGNHSHNLLPYVVTHSKSGTVHTLTGLPTAAGIFVAQFKAVANFDSGNTFAGGYTAKPMGEETALPDKAFITGDLVSVVVDVSGKKLGFRLGGAGAPKFPTYTGAHAIFGTEKKGYMELYGSGTLTAKANMNVEAFLVGGGGMGGDSWNNNLGGGGGGGGYVKLLSGIALIKDSSYPAVVGAGGNVVSNDGLPAGSTTMFANTAAGGIGGNGSQASISGKGGDGGSGGGGGGVYTNSTYYNAGNGGANGANGANAGYVSGLRYTGGAGAGVSTTFNGKTYAGGGGGGSVSGAAGSAGIGQNGGGTGGVVQYSGEHAIANTGSGGGGSGGRTNGGNGGAGGSGIIIIRWGY